MWCANCQTDLTECTCPDLEERLEKVTKPGTHVALPRCARCQKLVYVCKCQGEN